MQRAARIVKEAAPDAADDWLKMGERLVPPSERK